MAEEAERFREKRCRTVHTTVYSILHSTVYSRVYSKLNSLMIINFVIETQRKVCLSD